MGKENCLALFLFCAAVLFLVASSSEVDITNDKEKMQHKRQVKQAIKDKQQKERDDLNKSEMDAIRKDNQKMHDRWRRDSGY